MLLKRLLVFVVVLLFTVPVLAQGELDATEVRQWASSAEATSEYTVSGWSAMQATGAPDTDSCGDLSTAWASATSTERAALTLYYDTPVIPTRINIFQTYNPGAITSVQLIPADGSSRITLPDSADPGTDCPGVFSVFMDPDLPATNGIVINLDQSITGNWNEIDAVELVGITLSDADGNDVTGGDPVGTNTGAPVDREQPIDTPTTDTDTDYEFDGPMGMSVTCDDGTSFSNGVEIVVVNMRTGFNYTATAIGLNGFDPILAVLGESGRGLCTDDDSNAAAYSANLPTTGQVNPSNTNSQVVFSNNGGSAFADISLVVGGFNDQPGEFLLVLEGMALTTADNAGDPFSIQITPGMIASGVDPTVYMISVTDRFDPLIALIDGDYNFIEDDDKNAIACDDAGNSSLCWGTSYSLNGSYVSRSLNRQVGGFQFDAMLTFPLQPGFENLYLNYLMRSAGMDTYGDYVVVFHVGIGE